MVFTLTQYLQELSFTQSRVDSSLHIFQKKGIILYLLMYVDDLLLTGNNQIEIQTILMHLHKRFSMKDLGPLLTFLGIQDSHTHHGVLLHQQAYALTVLRHTCMEHCHSISNPSVVTTPSLPNDLQEYAHPTLYRQLVSA